MPWALVFPLFPGALGAGLHLLVPAGLQLCGRCGVVVLVCAGLCRGPRSAPPRSAGLCLRPPPPLPGAGQLVVRPSRAQRAGAATHCRATVTLPQPEPRRHPRARRRAPLYVLSCVLTNG
eukprot:gene1626-biopygen22860